MITVANANSILEFTGVFSLEDRLPREVPFAHDKILAGELERTSYFREI